MANITVARQCEGYRSEGWSYSVSRCTNIIPAQEGAGRPKRYCSDTCRSGARRQREAVAITHIPRCAVTTHAGDSRSTGYLTTASGRQVAACELCAQRTIELVFQMTGRKVTYAAHGLTLAELRRQELAREEAARATTKPDSSTKPGTPSMYADDVEDPEDDTDAEREQRVAVRIKLYGYTTNVGITHKSSRCRARHHIDCTGWRKIAGGLEDFCLCTCHDDEDDA